MQDFKSLVMVFACMIIVHYHYLYRPRRRILGKCSDNYITALRRRLAERREGEALSEALTEKCISLIKRRRRHAAHQHYTTKDTGEHIFIARRSSVRQRVKNSRPICKAPSLSLCTYYFD
jgi:hypothetical protein